MKRLRILLGDDHSLILSGIKGLLEHQYEIVGLADNGKNLVEAALHLKPDVVVLDISMPVLNGIDAMREIKRALPATKVIVLTMHQNTIYLQKALEAGASAYVLKSGAAEELLTAVEKADQGMVYVSSGFPVNLVDTILRTRNKTARSALELTSRQRQVLQLVAEGRQNKEIANIIHVSVRTVEFHRSSLMQKLGANSVAELTRFAIQEGLIEGPQMVHDAPPA
ncbi:MAG: response regulator transcription factor [Acidobacteriia bacterium]|nr:response regulator transcription factor [Terriglobia bacterium]